MTLQIKPVTTPEELEQFLDVPLLVYQNDPHWVQPLRKSMASELSAENTFRSYGELQPFLAWRDNRAVGRIVAAVNRRLIEREGVNVGLFGYFEVINDFEAAEGLLQAAEDWLRDRNMTQIRGPINLSTHNSCLFLIDGFDSDPFMMMPYNPSYYPQFMEKAHWQKAKDAYAYLLPLDRELDPKFEKGYRIATKSGITFRPINTKGEAFEQDSRSLYNVFTKAFENNWSSSARTEEDFVEEAKDLKDVVDPEIFPVAEDNGKMIGFLLSLPDYNIALKHVNGKLNFWGILKLLWYRRKIDRVRVIAITSFPEYRRRMVALALVYLTFINNQKKKNPYKSVELSYVWEDNMASRKVIEATGAKVHKTYRVYEKKL